MIAIDKLVADSIRRKADKLDWNDTNHRTWCISFAYEPGSPMGLCKILYEYGYSVSMQRVPDDRQFPVLGKQNKTAPKWMLKLSKRK